MSDAISISGPVVLGEAAAAVDEAEWALIRSAQGGCPKAFRQLVERHQGRVHHFCYQYLRNEEDALEACQDTFVRAHRALRRFKPRAKFSTWLFRIALNLCRDRARKQRPATVRIEDMDGSFACDRAVPDEAVMRDADLGKLDRGLAALPSRLRVVLTLVCLYGLSHRDCAEVLKCSERAVEGRLYRARQRLAEWWEREAS